MGPGEGEMGSGEERMGSEEGRVGVGEEEMDSEGRLVKLDEGAGQARKCGPGNDTRSQGVSLRYMALPPLQ